MNTCSKKSNILVLSAGRRVELVRSFQNALRFHLPESKVYAADLRPDLSAACQIADSFFSVPKVDASGYIDSVLELCEKESVKMVVPTIDTELYALAKRKKDFEEKGIDVIVSCVELVEACRDKRKTNGVYESLGLDYPEVYDKDNLKFPCFCKPYDGSSSIGAYLIHHAGMLTAEILNNERNMFMEFVGKEYGEYTVDAYYNREGELCCLVPRQRIEVRGGEVSKGATRKNYVYGHLRYRLEKLQGAQGCITFQVFANPSTHEIKALEINPRFGGGFPLSCAAGANYPDWLVREYLLSEKIDFYDKWEDNLLMLRYDAKVLVHES